MKYLLLFLFIASYNIAQAQKHPILIGLKFTAERSQYTRSWNREHVPITCLGGGFQAVKYINSWIGLEGGFLYIQRGVEYSFKRDYGTGRLYKETRKYSHYYLAFPLLIRIKVKSFYISTGASLDGHIVSAEWVNGRYGKGVSIGSDPNISKTNFSFISSMGWQFKVSKLTQFYIEARYTCLLKDISEVAWRVPTRAENIGLGIGVMRVF